MNWNEQGILIQRVFLEVGRGNTDIELFHPESGQFTTVYTDKSDAAVSSHDGNYSLIRTGEWPFGDNGPDYGLIQIDHTTGSQVLIEERRPIFVNQISFSPDNKYYVYIRTNWKDASKSAALTVLNLSGLVVKEFYLERFKVNASLVATYWLDNEHLLLLCKEEQFYTLYQLPIDNSSEMTLIYKEDLSYEPLEVIYIPRP